MSFDSNTAKELAQGYASLFLFDFLFSDGATLYVAEHALTFGGHDYSPRVLQQRISAIEALSPNGIDIPPDISLTLADADQEMAALDVSSGFRGARVTVTQVFYDFATETFSADSSGLFIGRCNRPESTDEALTVSAGYILNLAAKMEPSFPLEARCPKIKPRSADQVALADVADSPFFACGSTTTADCGFTKTGCAAQNDPLRFGGIVYEIPPASRSREYVSGNWLTDLRSNPSDAAYGDYAPIGFGTGWVDCKVLGSWPDANSTRGEAIVCEGRVKNILKVLVNDEQLPAATDLDGNPYIVEDALFRYNVISRGDRTGALNTDAPWNGDGDPHGSLCVIEWCVHRKVADGSSPRVRALVQFEDVTWYQPIDSIVSGLVTFANNTPNTDTAGNPPYTVTISGNSNAALNGEWELSSWAYGPPGTITLSGTSDSGTGGYIAFAADSRNFAWAVLRLLKRAGLAIDDVDLDSFALASAYFTEQIDYVDLDGATAQHDRYACSLVINQRRSVADIITGMLRACNSHLGRNPITGKITLRFRSTIALQQPTLPSGSNYGSAVAGGYLAYHFDESSIVRDGGKSTLIKPSRGGAGIPNSVTIAFANADRDYSGDSTRAIDADDINRMGQEIPASLACDGVASLDHAKRVAATYLAEQLDGDSFELVSTFKGLRLSVGDIIGLSSIKRSLDVQPMRVQRIAPEANYWKARYGLMAHDDAWYADSYGQADDPERGDPRRDRLARPAFAWAPYQTQPDAADPLFDETEWTYGLQLGYEILRSGSYQPVVTITGKRPVNAPASLMAPVLAHQGTTSDSGGAIAGDGRIYYVAMASRLSGKPGPLSNACEIAVAQSGSDNTITVPVRFLDSGGDGYYVFVGPHPQYLCATNDAGYDGSASSVTITSIPKRTWGAPDTEYDRTVVRPKLIWHAGVFGAALTGVGTRTMTIAGAGWTTDQWAGYDIAVLAKADLSELGVLHFRILSNTDTVLTIRSDSPDPDALGVTSGDVVVMMPLPSVSGLILTDANWENTLSNSGAGLTPDQEVGRILRIIAGAGRGYSYRITGNTTTSITVAGPWIVTPDSTSRYIIEDAAPLPKIATDSQIDNDDQSAEFSIRIPVANYAGETLLLEVVMLDGGGSESAVNPLRMIYVNGTEGTRAVTANTTQLITDGLVLCDTAAGDITYTLLPIAQQPNRPLIVKKVSSDAYTVTVVPDAGDDIEGSASIVLRSMGEKAGLKANG